MTLSARDRVRRDVQDKPQHVIHTLEGDSRTTRFLLSHQNVSGATVYTVQSGVWAELSGVSVGENGTVSLPSPEDGEIRVEYDYTVFSDADIDDYLDTEGDELGAKVAICEALMFDELKRGQWRAPDGTEVDNRLKMDTLTKMHAAFLKQQERGSLAYGTLVSWGEHQGQ